MKQWFLKVVVDTNDGDDYSVEIKVSGPEVLNDYTELLTLIKKNNGFFPVSDQGNAYTERYQELGVDYETYITFRERFLPFPEYGFHTIESMELIELEIFQTISVI